MPGLDDYGALLRSGAASVPDYAADEAQKQLRQIQMLDARTKLAEQQREFQEQDSFQHDLTGVLTSPSAQGYSALIAKHPKFAQQVKSSWDLMDKAKQDSDLQSGSEIYAAAANGKYDLAATLLQRRIEADKAAGQPVDPHDQTLLDGLKSDDPVQQKAAMGMIGYGLAAITGPDKFEQTLGALTKASEPALRNVEAGGTVVQIGSDGKATEVYKSPYIKTADGGILEANGTGGGDPASGSGAVSSPPSGAPRSIRNNNPGNLRASSFTQGLPGYQGKDDAGYAIFDNPQNGSSAQATLLAGKGYYGGGRRTVSSIIEKWAPRASKGGDNTDAQVNNYIRHVADRLGVTPSQQLTADQLPQMAQAMSEFESGQTGMAGRVRVPTASTPAQPTSQPAQSADGAPPGYHWLTPPKQKDAPSGYRYTPQGNLEPIPGGPAEQDEGIDDATATFYAQQMLTGGQMPTLGMGKAAAQARQQILKKVAQIAGAQGLTGNDFAVQVGHYKANLQNVQNLEKQAGTIEQNEKTALANGQQFIDRSNELSAQTRFPVVNSVTQSYLRHTGDPTVAAMDSAWTTFTTEYAKVVAGSPSGAGTLSDSARHEAMETMRGNYAVAQKKAAFKQMQADMANRMEAIRGQIAQGYKSLGSRAPGIGVNGGQTGLPSGSRVIGTYHGKRVIEVNGKRMVEQ